MPLIKGLVKTFYGTAKQFTFHGGYNSMEKFEKAPSEIYLIEFEFKDQLPFNNILKASGNTVTAVDESGTDASSTIVSGVEVVDDTKVRCKISAGTVNKDYIITFSGVSDPDSLTVVGKVLLQIREVTQVVKTA